ncbi:MAG: FAD-dependent oxidoreductase, partial [Muribaculum sp.]|nr:FAD-dependent oxidoreductase [Muribaculum sp.]
MNADIIVIGAGPGGMEVVAMALKENRSVVVIERDCAGGTCLNRGCIPTKALCRSAEVAADLHDADKFGISASPAAIDYAAVVSRKNKIVEDLRNNVDTMLSAATYVKGDATLVKDGVKVGDELYSAPTIVIATGSEPSTLPVPGAEYTIDSTAMLDMQSLPARLVIVGGGVIGMEFASILSTFGVSVTVIEYAPEILPAFDRETAKRLRSLLSRKGIKIITGAAVTAIGSDHTVTYESKGKTLSVEADAVLMAVGRRPVIPSGAVELGIEVGRRGIITDENFMTNIPGIYAICDVNGKMMLAHVAEAQART